MIDSVPPALIPVVVAVVAAVVGGLLWRLFKMAMKLVMLVVALIVIGGVVVWKNPSLVGMAKDALTEQTTPTKTPQTGGVDGP